MLNILTWNIRGFNRPLKHHELKRVVSQHKVNLVCSLETCVQQVKANSIRDHLFPGWTFFYNYQFSDLGRIWLMHDTSISLSVIERHEQCIHCEIHPPAPLLPLMGTFVYDANLANDRCSLWESLTHFSSGINHG